MKKGYPDCESPGTLDKNGDNGIRTRDLSVANAALSQLSYVPLCWTTAVV